MASFLIGASPTSIGIIPSIYRARYPKTRCKACICPLRGAMEYWDRVDMANCISKRPSVINQFPLPIRDLYLEISWGSINSEVSSSGWYSSPKGVLYFLNSCRLHILASLGRQFLIYVSAENAVKIPSLSQGSGSSTTSPPK